MYPDNTIKKQLFAEQLLSNIEYYDIETQYYGWQDGGIGTSHMLFSLKKDCDLDIHPTWEYNLNNKVLYRYYNHVTLRNMYPDVRYTYIPHFDFDYPHKRKSRGKKVHPYVEDIFRKILVKRKLNGIKDFLGKKSIDKLKRRV